MIDKTTIEAITQEWRSGVLLNPFAVIDEAVSNIKPKTKKIPKIALPICTEISKLFLDCTDYLVGSPEVSIKNVEEHFLTAMLLYLHCEAPIDEMRLSMVCELIVYGDPYGSEYDSTDLDKLFELLEDKNEKHPALIQYKIYQRSNMRKTVLLSVKKRLRPLVAISSSDGNLFDEIREDELFEFATALIHDCADSLQMPQAVYSMVHEIVFATVAMAYMMIEIDTDNQNRSKLFEILAQPEVYAKEITSALIVASPDSFPGLEGIIDYWYEHSEKAVAAGNINKTLLNGARKFFNEFR